MAEPETAPAAAETPADVVKRLALIEAWFAASFHGAPAMRDTEAFNHVRRAVDDLKRRLTEEKPQ